MSLLDSLLRSLGCTPRSPFTVDVEAALQPYLEHLAAQEQRPLPDLVNELLHQAISQRHTAVVNLHQWQALSEREQQVAALTCLGLTNQEIAQQMIISPNTVKTHIRNILYKCNVNSKTELRELLAGWDFQGWLKAQDIGETAAPPPTSAPPDEATP